jgi:transcriptional regulator with XRE-family HTH domain
MTAEKAKPQAARKSPAVKVEGLVGKVRKELGLGRREFSRLTGYSERAIVNWEGGRTPDEPALRRIKEIDSFRTRLSQVVKAEYIAEWLATPNDEIDGLKPLEVIERGEIDHLWDMIFYLESGIAS